MASVASTKRILLIDDDDSIRDVLHVCLKHLGGWDVVCADSVQSGLEILAVNQLDAVLLDLFPERDLELNLIASVQDSLTQAIPILVMLDRVSWSAFRQVRLLNVQGVIEKPFDPCTLALQIAHLLHWNGAEEC